MAETVVQQLFSLSFFIAAYFCVKVLLSIFGM
uniref:Uncharacterized protein n=1 Tax=Rhizophora mucronata TaxID=61149 RepID=A0A2P2N8T6_RHIMU